MYWWVAIGSFIGGFLGTLIVSRLIVRHARHELVSTFNAVLQRACALAESKNWLELQIFLHEVSSDQDPAVLREALTSTVRLKEKENVVQGLREA